jgi:hypothetical protein
MYVCMFEIYKVSRILLFLCSPQNKYFCIVLKKIMLVGYNIDYIWDFFSVF